MKKKLALILAACMTSLVMCVSFAGCSSGSSTDTDTDTDTTVSTSTDTDASTDEDSASTDVTGSYKLSSIITADGTSMTLEEYCAAYGVDSAGMDATYTLNADGTGTADIGGIGTEITYTVEGSTVNITVTANGVTTAYTYADGQISTTDANTGMTSVFSK